MPVNFTPANITERTLEIHERRAAFGAALNEALDIFTAHNEEGFDEVISQALRPIAKVMKIDRIAVYRLTEIAYEHCLKQLYHWEAAKGRLTEKSIQFLPKHPTAAQGLTVSMNDQCLTKRRDKTSEEEAAFMDLFAIKSLLTVPVFTHGKFWGAVFFQDHTHLRDFDGDCMDLYRSAARLCVSSIIRAEMTQKADTAVETFKSRERMMEMLVKIAAVFLSRSKSLSDDNMTLGVGLIADIVKIDQFSVWRNLSMPDGLYASQIYRWDKESGGTTEPMPDFQNVPYTRFTLPLQDFFSQGESVSSRASLLPENSIMKQLGIESAFITPVFSGSILWGFVLFADTQCECHFDCNCTDMIRSAAFLVANTVIRTEMEQAIYEENKLNSAMFDAAPIGLTICDDDFNFIRCNQAAADMFGVTQQYYFDHFYSLSPTYQPDGSKSRDKARENLERALSGERLVTEWIHCSPSGELIPTELTLTRTMYKGKYIVMGYIYDLRNVKKMESDITRLLSEVDYDALTGIYNRRFFDKSLTRIIELLSRSSSLLSLLLIDIDQFKKFNDTYGHIEGDQCLKMVAEVLADSVSYGDGFVARYGGEEFVAVLPNTDAAGARRVAEKMYESLRLRQIALDKKDGTTGYVTISIGGTTGIVDGTCSGEDYIQRADEMLYASKRDGRNRSTFGGVQV